MNKLKVTLGNIPDNCIEENAVSISKISITYSQNPDTNSRSDEYQYITISTQNNGCGEDGIYYDISIDSDHWSIDNEKTLSDIIKDFTSRLNFNIVKEKDLKTY